MLCESAQRYRALMVILQSHRTQNMILRCYPNVSAILRRHTVPNLVSCAFSTIPIFPTFNSLIYLSLLFFYMLCSIRREHSSRSFAPPKKWLFSMVTSGTVTNIFVPLPKIVLGQNIAANHLLRIVRLASFCPTGESRCRRVPMSGDII